MGGEAIGGQAGSSSQIWNYLGFPRGISGAELAQRAHQQAWVFGTRFVLMRTVTGITERHGGYTVSLSDESEVEARAVVVATGVSYKRLKSPGLEALTGAGVFYGASPTEAQGLVGEDVYVVGGGNSTGQAAIRLSRYARHVTLVVRGKALSEMSQYLQDEIDAAPHVTVRYSTEVIDGGGSGRLAWLTVRDASSGETFREAAAGLFVMIGAVPRTDWLPPGLKRDEAGYIVTGPDAVEPGNPWRPLLFETSLPGIFAVGDVRHGGIKRVASAVGEGSVAIQQVHQYLAGVVAQPVLATSAARKLRSR